MTSSKLLSGLRFSLVAFFLWSGSSLFGQFSVVSTSPVHGAAGVSSSATFSVTFNAPIDTSSRFPYPTDFFVSLFLYPDTLIGEPDSISLSPDLTTVYVHNLDLFPNTTYLFVIVDALSQAGDSLAMPYSLLFTTGSSLPTATVSGTINYPAHDPTGALVVLLDEHPFGEQEGEITNGKVVTGSGGSYSIDYVAPGVYWPAAIQDFYVNGEGDIEFKPGGGIGFYDANGDSRPDSILIAAGAQVAGIDFSLFTVLPQTARDPYPLIQSLAQNWAADAQLVWCGGDNVNPAGEGLLWEYGFYSPVLLQQRSWVVLGELIIIAPDIPFPADTLALPPNWLNSDTVLAVAEAHGGAQFRQNYPDAEIIAFLGSLSFGEKEQRSISGAFQKPRSNLILQPFAFPSQWENSVTPIPLCHSTNFPQPYPKPLSFLATWFVQYSSPSTGEDFFLIIHAQTGVVLSEPATARAAEQMGLPVAQSWAADAKLWAVISQGTSVDSLGKTEFWNCLYYSALLDSLYGVVVWGQLPIFSAPPGWSPPDTSAIPAGWLDSDVAIAAAEAAGGAAYRNANQGVFVNAFLSRWYHVPFPGLTVWAFEYHSSTAAPLEILVDALSGTIVGIKENDPPNLPDRLIVSQNYPNPFNPTTAISFQLSALSNVELSIFNALGQRVKTLVNERMAAGRYTVQWDGRNSAGEQVGSGIYFYRVKAGQHSAMKKMALVR